MRDINPSDVTTLMLLLGQLEEVKLPADLVSTADQLLRLPSLRSIPAPPVKLIGLSDDELRAVLQEIGIAHALSGSGGPGATALDTLTRELATAIARELRGLADGILDQVRPRFDDAAAVVHHATTLGLDPRTAERDILKADNVEELRDAWSAVPAAARALDHLSSIRIQLSSVAGAPPAPATGLRIGEAVDEYAACMFRTDGRPWREQWEQSWQMWLRLCAGSPARLLSIDDSVQAARRAA